MDIKNNDELAAVVSRINIEVIDSGYAEVNTAWRESKICSPFSRLYYVKYGQGFLQSGENICVMKPGFVYLVPAGLLFNYWCEDTMHKLYFHINLYKPNGYDLLLGCNEFGSCTVSAEEIEKITSLYFSRSFADALYIKQSIYTTVTSILSSINFKTDEIMVHSDLVRKTISFINKNLSLQLNTKSLAERLFVSESTLAKLFKREVGVTVGKYIDDLIFFSAERMLQKSDLPIGKISEMLGFCDQFYFSRRFLKRYGETPRQYKNRMKISDIT